MSIVCFRTQDSEWGLYGGTRLKAEGTYDALSGEYKYLGDWRRCLAGGSMRVIGKYNEAGVIMFI